MASIGYMTTYTSSGIIGFLAVLYMLWYGKKYSMKGYGKVLNTVLVSVILAMIIAPIVYVLISGLISIT